MADWTYMLGTSRPYMYLRKV